MSALEQRELQELGLTPEQLTAPQTNGRKQRSDAGKPRESVFLTIPGVRFDLAADAGREAYLSWVSGALASESCHQMIPASIEQLLAHIDRLRELQGKR